jgi:hypothetical protein
MCLFEKNHLIEKPLSRLVEGLVSTIEKTEALLANPS